MIEKEIRYLILYESNKQEYIDQILDFLDPENKRRDHLKRSLENSNYIIIALDWKKVVGLNQVITDYYYAAYFINLQVDPEYRKSWIWREIFRLTLDEAKRLEIKNIMLTTDPSHPWLQDFYWSLGFVKWEDKGTYMYLKK